MKNKIILTDVEPDLSAKSEDLAKVLVERLGLFPRKKGSTEKMHNVLVQLYEKAKESSRKKDPTLAVMTVEEMAMHAGITRQTMYEYLGRWLQLDLITKASFIDQDKKVIIGYRLHGNTLEHAFDRVKVRVNNNLELTRKYMVELQRTLKNEKISKKQRKQGAEEGSGTEDTEESDDDEGEG